MAVAQRTFRNTWRNERTSRAARAARRANRQPRTPLAVHLARALARAVPSSTALRTLRTVLLSLAGLGLLSYAAWLWLHPLGYAAAGLSLLAVEYLVSSDRGRGGGG